MDFNYLEKFLTDVYNHKITADEAASKLKNLYFEDIGFAHIDHHRSLRKDFPEVIFGQGKTYAQIIGIMERMVAQENIILVTRVDKEKSQMIMPSFPSATYHEDAKMIVLKRLEPEDRGKGKILIISAGTSDIPVAREAYLTAKAMGNDVDYIFDVGVAGIHRLFSHMELIRKASVLVVIAGMEGALPSVVAGMVSRPVIAVPTSIGYGASFGGMTALFAMLNSCSSNVAVVNIDNGFGAGYMASIINRV
ncbi:MAG: nickel pincer cofactor biosynthesis protein LarB [Desulfobacterales bacterium]|nr:nickel pincer cofactor biosynthesis protein LarB [Desulfobacterales bacterium]MBF0397078.1 nickel pincer cofactor biosynthesis protein LarB [Desulfobacterales bacterium]